MQDMERMILADVLAHPQDDLPRRAYADWLLEYGDQERQNWGAFIHWQLDGGPKERTHGWFPWWGIQTRHTERAYILGLPHDWQSYTSLCTKASYNSMPGFSPRVELQRGFVMTVACAEADWHEHGPRLVSRHPIHDLWLVRWLARGEWTEAMLLQQAIDKALGQGIYPLEDRDVPSPNGSVHQARP